MMRKMLSTKIPEDFGEFLEDFNKMNLRYDLGLFNLIPNRNILSLNVSWKKSMMIQTKVIKVLP